MERYIGSMVSLDCGDTLGTYQGQVVAIDSAEHSITIVKPYRNGIPFKSPQVTLRSEDIKKLSIVKTPDEVKELPNVINKQLSLLSKSPAVNPSDGVKPPPAVNALSSFIQISETSGVPNITSSSGAFTFSKLSASVPSASAMTHVFPANSNNRGIVLEGLFEGLKKVKASDRSSASRLVGQSLAMPNGKHHNSQLNSSVPGNATSHPVAERKRTSSTSDASQQNRRAITPRKVDRQQQKNNECFRNSEVLDDEFDFESNLALFDKQAIYEEIEKDLVKAPSGSNARNCRSEQKYRCDENIIQGPKATVCQIKVVNGNGQKDIPSKEYTTDLGLVVPSLTLEQRERLFSAAEKHGFSRERMVEMIGRSGGEMVLQLLGGNNRFEPKNLHQCPLVVVLCGTGLQAAIGINCARHLAVRPVKVVLFLSQSCPRTQEVEAELQLYQLTRGKLVTKCEDLSNDTVDLIVTAIDACTDTSAPTEPWHQAVADWANQCKARSLAIDPPIEGCLIDTTWCLTAALPLSYSERCGLVYLCDLSIPQKVFKEAGIVYHSPFAHKFIIPLHAS